MTKREIVDAAYATYDVAVEVAQRARYDARCAATTKCIEAVHAAYITLRATIDALEVEDV